MKSFLWKIHDIEQQNLLFDNFLNENLRAREWELEKTQKIQAKFIFKWQCKMFRQILMLRTIILKFSS